MEAAESPAARQCTLSVYFCASDGDLARPRTWVEVFQQMTLAADVTAPSSPLPDGDDQLKMAFNGCATERGLAGLLFGAGIASQLQRVVDRVQQLAAAAPDAALVLNCLGCSRGAVAALLLAKRVQPLCALFAGGVRVHLCLLDPVPGNYLVTALLDRLLPLHCTLTSQALDLTDCPHLRRVLALYPYRPLPAWMAHAPLLPRYPAATAVDEDATLGAHQAAFSVSAELASRLSFVRVLAFMQSVGTALDHRSVAMNSAWFGVDPPAALDHLDRLLDAGLPVDDRAAHGPDWLAAAAVRCRSDGAVYLNRHHRQLAAQLATNADAADPDPAAPLLARRQHYALYIRRDDACSLTSLVIALVLVSGLLVAAFFLLFAVYKSFKEPIHQ